MTLFKCIVQEVPERKIDIEELVDLCFEEEFRRKVII